MNQENKGERRTDGGMIVNQETQGIGKESERAAVRRKRTVQITCGKMEIFRRAMNFVTRLYNTPGELESCLMKCSATSLQQEQKPFPELH